MHIINIFIALIEMQREDQYLDIGYDRSHLNNSGYNV